MSGQLQPQYKHGRYSKYLPEKLVSSYENAQKDPELLSTREDLALVDTRINELLERLHGEEGGEPAETWRDMKKIFEELVHNIDDGNEARTRGDCNRLSDIINRGYEDYAAWIEITRLLDRRKGLIETERKRLMDMRQLLTTEQAVMLVSKVLEKLESNVRKVLSSGEDEKGKANKILAGVGTDLRGILS